MMTLAVAFRNYYCV